MLDLYIKQLINVDFRWGKLTFITARKTGRHTYIHIHTYSHVGAHSQPFSTHTHTLHTHTRLCSPRTVRVVSCQCAALNSRLNCFRLKIYFTLQTTLSLCRCVFVAMPRPAHPMLPGLWQHNCQQAGECPAALPPVRPSAQACFPGGLPAPTT